MDLNVAPYYDDFNKDKNYLKILFRPGRSVQGRELTQMQTVLQEQLRKMSDHILVDGTPVLNAKMKVDFNKHIIVLSTTDSSGDPVIAEEWNGRLFTGNTSGASAEVTNFDEDSHTIFFDYRGGVFQNGETITTFNLAGQAFPTKTASIVSQKIGVYAYQESGIIYTNGYFVHVPEQSVMVDNDVNTGSYKIGFEFAENIINSEMDSSLLDPANGSPNQNAPGADRLNGTIVPKSYKSTETASINFHTLIVAENGRIVKENQSTQYSAIMDTMASRTFDESGNYTVKDFPIILDKHESDLSKVNIALESGKAYVQGYKTETLVSTNLDADRARETQQVNNEQITIVYGPYVVVKKNANGSANIHKMIRVQNKPSINLYSGNAVVGTARVISADIDNTGNIRYYLADTAKSAALFPSIDKIAETADTTRYAMIDAGLNDISAACPIYGLSESPVDSVLLNETNYDVIRSYHSIVKDGSGNFSIVADDNFTNFQQQSQNGIVAITTDTGLSLASSQYTSTPSDINGGRSSVSINITDASILTSTVDVIVRQHKTQGNPKTKTLTRHIDTFTLSGSITKRTLPHYDVFRIVSIKIANVEQNINNYEFDNGQTDFYYDFGSIDKLTSGVAYSITYDYFNHSGSGDYFCVNSYDNVNNQTAEPEIYKLIPTYISDTGLEFNLRNCLDFRRTKQDNTSGTNIVRPNSSLNVDYSFYLSRKDKIYINKNGEFNIIKGVSSKTPDSPESTDGSMLLYELTFPAYTFEADDVEIEHVDNKRYTMRDIGKLEKRLDIMEYYTSLSLLESKTDAMTVLDANGFTKFKNGILVDSFVGHGVGNVNHPEYRCSMDSENGVLRTPFAIESFDLIQDTANINMIFHDHIATVSYTISPWIIQNQCSEFTNVNPYNVTSWIGQLSMTPSSDNWVDTKRAPSITTNFEGANDAMKQNLDLIKDLGYMSTQWNSWQTTWAGSKQYTRTTNIAKSAWNTTLSSRTTAAHTELAPDGVVRRSTRVFATTRRDVTTTTDTKWIQNVSQRRSGTTLQVIPGTITKSVGDKIIDTSLIPWMRHKEIHFVANGMKPNVIVYPTFDDVDVSLYTKLTTAPSYNTALRSDASGKVDGMFAIPSGKFRTGSRLFRLTDDLSTPTTSAEFVFEASGIMNTKQENIISVDNPQIAPKSVSQTRSIQNNGAWSNSTHRTEGGTSQSSVSWWDPVAQSFLVAEDDGVFVNSVDLYFKSKDTGSLPITLFIVENENGYPSQRKIPFSEVTLQTSSVNVDVAGRVATRFSFSDPVYLTGSTEYSFVVMSNSNKYEMFVGKVGGRQYKHDTVSNTWRNNGDVITKQPYTGVMFTSQNSSTWSADQERDIKFAINRCVFSTNEATAKFKCKDLNTTYTSGYSFDLSTLMLNMDTLKLTSTDLSHDVKLRNLDIVSVENKSNYSTTSISEIKTVGGESAPILVTSKLKANNSYVSPVINLQRNSLLGISNIIKDIPDSTANSFKNAGTYVSNIVNLVNPSDDLRVYLDTFEVPNSEVKVSFKTTEYIPRHVNTLSAIGDVYAGSTMQIYWRKSGTKELTYKASFIASEIDGTRMNVSQITDTNAFVLAGEFASNNIDLVYIIKTNNRVITEAKDWIADDWVVGSVVNHNGKLYQAIRIITNSDGEPTDDSVIWNLLPSTNCSEIITESTSAEWREMKAIDNTNNTGQYTEKTYTPVADIDSEFSSFSIKIDLLALDSINIPNCRAMRAMALY